MAKRMLLICLAILLAFSGMAFAQGYPQADDDDDDTFFDDDDDDDNDDDDTTGDDDDDDSDFFDSTIGFDLPTCLEPNTDYEFNFTVYNNAVDLSEKANWIYMVDLTMPSADFVVDETNLVAPTPLHLDIDRWEASFNPTANTITWQCFGVVTSAEIGDIRVQDSLSFQFYATSDDTAGADSGFEWVLYGDEGDNVYGTAYIDGSCDDDDDDDDTGSGGDDDDDGGSAGGCGC